MHNIPKESINNLGSHTNKVENLVEVSTNNLNLNKQEINLESTSKSLAIQADKIFSSIEEHKLIIHFKNGDSIEALTDSQLVILSRIYQFTPDDLIRLQRNTDFLYYLNETNLVPFNKLPNVVKQNIDIAKLAFDCGYYEFIAYIPIEQQTQQICDSIFCGLSTDIDKYFSYLNDEFKTSSMCYLYLQYAKKIDFALIPQEFRDELGNDFISKIIDKKLTDIKINDQQFKGIELLPESILLENPDIVVKACISNFACIQKLPPAVINQQVLQLIATKTITCIPRDKINIELLLIRIKADTPLSEKELAIINSYISSDKQIIKDALLADLENHPILYLYIDDNLTEEKCISYCDKNQYFYTKLPVELQANSNLIKYLLAKDPNNISIINSKYLTKEHCTEAYNNLPLQPGIGADRQDVVNYRQSKHQFINHVPIEHRSLDMWCYLCSSVDRKHIHEIPDYLFTNEILTQLVDEYIQWDNRFDIAFIEDLFAFKLLDTDLEKKILTHSVLCCARFSTALFTILKSTKIPQSFKDKLWIKVKNGDFKTLEHSVVAELYSKTSPLKAIPATVATAFLSSCYKFSNASKKTSISDTAQSLKSYINKKLTILPLDDIVNDFSTAKVTGGRTVQVNTSETTALFYKFRKLDEPLNEFIKEGYFLEFLQKTTEGKQLHSKLWSDIPVFEKMVRIPINLLPKCAFECEDGFEIYTDNNKVECVDVLVLSGSVDYLQYAHKIDTCNSQSPFYKPEQGMLKACHDLGVFMSFDIYHTSILPAFHSYEEDRRWISLHMLLRQLYDKPVREFLQERTDLGVVGRLLCWDTVATERPDCGYTGIRDVADCEFYGEIFTPLTRIGCHGLKLFSGIIQNILATNTTCECLLATILLYARLHKNQDNYHYKNEEYRKKTAIFIEDLFSTFLVARLQDATVNLQEFMQLTNDDYAKWLDRAVTELLYWTAKQTPVDFKENNNVDESQSYIYDCFANHIKQGILPEALYDDNIVPTYVEYPSSYISEDANGNNLGACYGTLPLLALLNFMVLMNIKLNENGVY